MRIRYAAPLLALALLLPACTSDGPDEPREPGDPEPTSSPTGGAHPLEWQETGESPEQTVVVGRDWRAVASPDGGSVSLRDPDRDHTFDAGNRRRFDQVLLTADYAVLVAQDRQEERPAVGTVFDLTEEEPVELIGPAPAVGGTWALHGDELRYPRLQGGRYCVVAVHLPSGESQVDWCAEPRQGWSRMVSSRWGTALMTFDDTRPISCRTLAVLVDGTPAPVDGVPECAGWDVVATESGAVWTALTDEQNVSEGQVAATVDGEVRDLGTAATGTLTPCGDSVFFARTDELVRVHPDGRDETVWEADGDGPGYLTAPACADDALTLTYLGEDGDQQLWAPVAASDG